MLLIVRKFFWIVTALFSLVGVCHAEDNSTQKPWNLIITEGDFRGQYIHRQPKEAGWPFTVDKGLLHCVRIFDEDVVYFTADIDEFAWENENDEAYEAWRTAIITNNPWDLVFLNAEVQDLFVEREDVARRMEMILPYFQVGKRLCDQPRGTILPSGEL